MVGKTTKADDPSQRGIHGEGLTMGALVAAREGRIMEIFNQDEKWIPYIGESSDFPGNQVLKFRVYKTRKFDRHKVKIQITKEEWREIKPRFLRGIPKKEEGDLLTNKKHRGKIYVGGIQVGETQSTLGYGYNLPPGKVTVNRDRDTPSDFDLARQMALIHREDLGNGKRALSLLEKGFKDTESFKYYFWQSDKEKVFKVFQRKYGEDCVPVRSNEEAEQATYHGLRGVISPEDLVEICQDFVNEKLRSVGDVKSVVVNLTSSERRILESVMELVKVVDVTVVDFFDPKVQGKYECGEVYIARPMLKDFRETLEVMIEEVAHANCVKGGHGREFSSEVLKISSGIIERMMK